MAPSQKWLLDQSCWELTFSLALPPCLSLASAQNSFRSASEGVASSAWQMEFISRRVAPFFGARPAFISLANSSKPRTRWPNMDTELTKPRVCAE